MSQSGAAAEGELTFAQVCALLEVRTDQAVVLREHGLLPFRRIKERQRYAEAPVQLARHLVRLARLYQWSPATLAWYADLLFIAHVGRAALNGRAAETPVPAPARLPTTWLETLVADEIARDLGMLQPHSRSIATILRILVAGGLGEGQHWPDQAALHRSALWPIITQAQVDDHDIVREAREHHAEAGQGFYGIVQAFSQIAPPVAPELRELVAAARQRLPAPALAPLTVPPEEQAMIEAEPWVAIDELYVTFAGELHEPPETVAVEGDTLAMRKTTITTRVDVSTLRVDVTALDREKSLAQNIVDITKPYMGAFGARLIFTLYEIANDRPYYRQPVIHFETNELLDRLGLQRDQRGVHYNRNRVRLRDTLAAANMVRIQGKRRVIVDGEPEIVAFDRPILTILDSSFDPAEAQGQSVIELLRKGLPKRMTVQLNYYEGVRRPDGSLGNTYRLMPRLTNPELPAPASTQDLPAERLRTFLLSQARRTQPPDRNVMVTRQVALDHAGIHDSNVTRQARKLARVLERLVRDGVVERHEPVPTGNSDTFTIILAADPSM